MEIYQGNLVSLSAPTTGQTTVGTTAVPLPNVPNAKYVLLAPRPGNTGQIYIGPSGVTTTTGFPITSATVIPTGNPNLQFAISDVAAQSVCHAVYF